MRRYFVLVIGVLVAVTCVRLGVWQLDRLSQRRARNAVADQRLAMPPLALDPTLTASGDVDSLRYRRVVVRGRFDLDRELVVLARAYHGVPGVHVVTPLMVSDSAAVLVERGWLPSPDGRTIDSSMGREPGLADVTGVLLKAEPRDVGSGEDIWPRRVLSADPAAAQAFYPYHLFPLLLRRDAVPDGVAGMRAVALPEQTDGPHLSYAMQWFTFATIAVVGSVILFVRQGRTPEDVRTPPHVA